LGFSHGGCLPNGQQVTFTWNGTTLGTANISGAKANLSTTSLPAGSDAVEVSYGGNANYSSASASVMQTVH